MPNGIIIKDEFISAKTFKKLVRTNFNLVVVSQEKDQSEDLIDMNLEKIRLEKSQVSVICDAFKASFLENDHLWLFGSRANLHKKGGDIDLYIETSLGVDKVLEAKLIFARQLFKAFDDQKIDIVICHQGAKNLPIYKHAKSTGVQIL